MRPLSNPSPDGHQTRPRGIKPHFGRHDTHSCLGDTGSRRSSAVPDVRARAQTFEHWHSDVGSPALTSQRRDTQPTHGSGAAVGSVSYHRPRPCARVPCARAGATPSQPSSAGTGPVAGGRQGGGWERLCDEGCVEGVVCVAWGKVGERTVAVRSVVETEGRVVDR